MIEVIVKMEVIGAVEKEVKREVEVKRETGKNGNGSGSRSEEKWE